LNNFSLNSLYKMTDETTTLTFYYDDLRYYTFGLHQNHKYTNNTENPEFKIPPETVTSLSITNCQNTRIPKDLRHYTNLKNFHIVDVYMPCLPLLSNTVETICCVNNNLTTINHLPENLVSLRICYNFIKVLPELPTTVTTLRLSCNAIHQLPLTFHEGLEYVDVAYNLVKVLPDTLPESLTTLDIVGNMVERLPPRCGANLRTLKCSSNRIRELPPDFANTYAGLEELNILNNPVANIVSLPQTIRRLRMEYTRIHMNNYRFPVPESLEYVCCELKWMLELAQIRGIYATTGISMVPSIPGTMMRQVDRFRELYFAVKLRDPFWRWLWRIREPQIREELSPANLAKYLEEHNADDETMGGLDRATDAFFGI